MVGNGRKMARSDALVNQHEEWAICACGSGGNEGEGALWYISLMW